MTTTKLEDSNIANYGSKDHKDAKEKKAQAEKEYKGAGAAVGIEVWRIEGFGVKKITDKKSHGTFFKGDCYIVLNTYKVPGNNALKYNAHFWLGGASTQDERGTAAFKVVELDDLLGDLPVQYREVEGCESAEFMSCFGGNIFLCDGGIDGAFKNVKPTEYVPRLMHFKGQKKIRVTQVPTLCSSLNQGDVFLLDMGLELIQWNGPLSAALERRKAMEMINSLKDDRNGRPKSRVLDGDEDDEVFWKTLGGKGPIASATDDAKVVAQPTQLYRVSDASGSMQSTLIASGNACNMSLLDVNDCFIVDITSQIYIWVGSSATPAERSSAMKTAVDYLTASGRPLSTPISRLIAGAETQPFKNALGATSM